MQGELNLTGRFFKLQPEKLDIISGTGAYARAKGKETITKLRVEPGLYSVELMIDWSCPTKVWDKRPALSMRTYELQPVFSNLSCKL